VDMVKSNHFLQTHISIAFAFPFDLNSKWIHWCCKIVINFKENF